MSDLQKKQHSQEHVTVVSTAQDITERKQSEEALRDAQKKWSSLVENTDDIIIIVDPDAIIQDINNPTPPYKKQDVIGKSVYDFIPKEQYNDMENSLQKVFKKGESVSYEVSSEIPQAGTMWFRTKVIPIKDKDKVSGAIEIVTNITDSKKTEEALLAKERAEVKAKLEKKKSEELNIAYQQIRTSEQQLKASNQQLRVSEQQLKAANQQLRASEQQLQAANQQLEAKEQTLRNKIADLERFNKLMVGRELDMVKLKGEVNSLLEKSGEPKKYNVT